MISKALLKQGGLRPSSLLARVPVLLQARSLCRLPIAAIGVRLLARQSEHRCAASTTSSEVPPLADDVNEGVSNDSLERGEQGGR